METSSRTVPGLLLLAAHAVLAALAWRDIGRRSPDLLRGSRPLWRVLTALNTGGQVAYLRYGRRR